MQIVGVFGLGTTELVIILLIVLMLFGVGKLPQVARQLGGGIRDFNKALRGEEEEAELAAKDGEKLPNEGKAKP
jgi:sec-independent protein translocase protein TatA